MDNVLFQRTSAKSVTQTLVAAEVYDRLQRAMSSDPDGFCELYHDYLADARQTLNYLHLACESQNGDDLRFKAHYLKSSSLILGISPVAHLCAELQDAGHAADFDSERRKLQELASLLSLVQEELEKRLGPRVVPVEA